MEFSEMKGLLHRIRSVYPLSEYRVILEFDEDGYRVVSIQPFIEKGGVFAPLWNQELFRTVRVSESHTIEWENGVDLDPDVLYAVSVPLAIPDTLNLRL